jgi:hypothetical protein
MVRRDLEKLESIAKDYYGAYHALTYAAFARRHASTRALKFGIPNVSTMSCERSSSTMVTRRKWMLIHFARRSIARPSSANDSLTLPSADTRTLSISADNRCISGPRSERRRCPVPPSTNRSVCTAVARMTALRREQLDRQARDGIPSARAWQ